MFYLNEDDPVAAAVNDCEALELSLDSILHCLSKTATDVIGTPTEEVEDEYKSKLLLETGV